jgi:large subunit ribosomal protein L21
MYAVIKTGGKQYRVQENQILKVEKIQAAEGTPLDIEEVLLIADGEQITVGTPYIKGSKVTATVKSHGRDRKVEIVKFRRRKHYLKRMGHRQNYTELQITGINSATPESATPEEIEA